MKFRTYLVPALAVLTISLCSAAPAWSVEYDLKKPALKVGQKIDTESTMTMSDGQLEFNVQGQTIKGTMSLNEHKVQQSRVTAAADGKPTESEIEIKVSTQKQSMTVNGNPRDTEKDQPLQGTTIISKLVDGKWQNHLKTGEPTPEQDKALKKLKAFDADDMYEDHPVAPGATWSVAPDKISKLLGESATSDTKGSMACKFERVEDLDGRKCAVVSVVMKLSGTPESQAGATLTMDLKGNIYRSLDDKVDVKVDLAGTMSLEGPIPAAPPGSVMKANGPLTMKQTATVSK